MRIEVFIDDESVARQTLVPPATLELDTEGLADGPHRLRVHAIEDSGTVGVEEIPFTVRNGPGIAVVGLSDGDTVRGRIPLLVNAFASRPGDVFEPVRAETPAPIPTWAWVLFLVIAAWGMWYVATELRAYQASKLVAATASSQASIAPGAPASSSPPSWAALGEQVYGNKCSACHQLTGQGLPGVFPPLKGSAVVTASRPDRAHPHRPAWTVGQVYRWCHVCDSHARLRGPAHRRRGGGGAQLRTLQLGEPGGAGEGGRRDRSTVTMSE